MNKFFRARIPMYDRMIVARILFLVPIIKLAGSAALASLPGTKRGSEWLETKAKQSQNVEVDSPKDVMRSFSPVLEEVIKRVATGEWASTPFASAEDDGEIELPYLTAERLAQHIEDLKENDAKNQEFLPDLKTGFEVIPMHGEVSLGNAFARGRYSVTYDVVGYPEIVIRYQLDCEYLASQYGHHDTLTESVLQRYAASVQVGIPNYFISPPVGYIHGTRLKKLFFWLEEEESQICEMLGSTVRFTVMDKWGADLTRIHQSEFPDQQPAPKEIKITHAVAMAEEILDLTTRLHKVGIVHRVTNPFTIVDHIDKQGIQRFRFIDFSKAYLIDHEESEPEVPQSSAMRVFLSHWEMMGLKTTRRDDIFRTILLLGYLMYPHPWQWFASPENEERWKESEPIIRWDLGIDFFKDFVFLRRESKMAVMEAISEFEALVRQSSGEIDYDLLRETLHRATRWMTGVERPRYTSTIL
jgi:hypothetical protein